MEKIINKLINESIKGVDIYTHNGSTWLIFTESKRWVIELTESKTLWYNFNFFKNLFGYASLEVVQNQHLITKWVEDNVIGGVKRTMSETIPDSFLIEDTIQNGVKETCWNPEDNTSWVEGVIKEGMRSPIPRQYVGEDIIYKVIDKGVKKTSHRRYLQTFNLEDTIQDGTENDYWVMDGHDTPVDKVLDNGVKITLPLQSREYTGDIDDTLENGVKETKGHGFEQQNIIDNIVENGVKEIKPLPSQTGNKDWSEYYHGKEDRTKPFNDYLNDTLEMGVKIK